MKVIAIDPGTTQSAWVIMDSETLVPEQAGIDENETLRKMLMSMKLCRVDRIVIEMVASYGMPVGKEVFETCVWIGRFYEALHIKCIHDPELIYRREEKLHICESPKANDATIRHALIDRFAEHDLKFGRGTKKNQDWFYGFRQDMWAAYAVGLTFIETKLIKKDLPKETQSYRNLDYIDSDSHEFVKHEADYQVRKMNSFSKEIKLPKFFKKKKK